MESLGQLSLPVTALDAMVPGVVVLDPTGRVTWMNRAASHYAVTLPPEVFERARERCTIIPLPGGGGRSLMGAVVALHRETNLKEHVGAAVFITDPELGGRVMTGLLRELFGLTSVESRLVLALADGGSPMELAERLGLTREVVLQHLLHVAIKIGAERQSALVSVLSRLASSTGSLN